MSEEEKKAIEQLKRYIEEPLVIITDKLGSATKQQKFHIPSEIQALTILKLIEKQDKMIDLMAKDIDELSYYLEVDGRYCDFTHLTKSEIIEHFRKKVENERNKV